MAKKKLSPAQERQLAKARPTGPLPEETKKKISLANTKFTKQQLIDLITEYLDSFTQPQEGTGPTPTIAGLCVHIGITNSTLYRYMDNYPEIKELVDFLRVVQEDRLLTGALTSTLNSKFAAFLLERKLGYSPAPSSLVQNNNSINLSPELLAAALAELKK